MSDAGEEGFHRWVACAEDRERTSFLCWFEEPDEQKAFLRVLDWLEFSGDGYVLLFLRLMTPQECQDATETFYAWMRQELEQTSVT